MGFYAVGIAQCHVQIRIGVMCELRGLCTVKGSVWREEQEKKRTYPNGRHGRLGRRLGALLDVLARLAHASFLLLGELCVAASLFECLRLQRERLAIVSDRLRP